MMDKDLKTALGFVAFFVAAGYIISGVNALLEGTGLSPAELSVGSPVVALGVGVVLMYLIYEWGIRK